MNGTLIKTSKVSYYSGIFLISAASLIFEINLTRLFSLIQFYHFAFMIVSIALLGYGTSGTILTLFPRLRQPPLEEKLFRLSVLTAVSILAGFLLINWLHFDSFAIAFDPKQPIILLLQYLFLSLPFFFTGLITAILLSAYPENANTTYASNLTGAAAGCILALLLPSALGGEGLISLCVLIALTAAFVFLRTGKLCLRFTVDHSANWLFVTIYILFILLTSADITLRLLNREPLSFMLLNISPYKSLSYAMQYPEAKIIYQKWNAYSRVDKVRSAGIHSLPGLSYRYQEIPPVQDGIFIDGDNLNPMLGSSQDMTFTGYLPSKIAYILHPQADVLVLGSRGGMDVTTALANDVNHVTAVEPNRLILEAAQGIYLNPNVKVITESERSFLRKSDEKYDLIILGLSETFHPVRSGAYSLAEDYRFTLESFQEILSNLSPDGLLVITRWLQTPPSEELKIFTLAVEAMEKSSGLPKQQIVVFRSYNTATFLIKNSAYTHDELEQIRDFLESRSYDYIFGPEVKPEEVNRFNILPEPVYYLTFQSFLQAESHQNFYDNYLFEVSPPIDDKPFFGNYFKWIQTKQIIAEFGKSWQPFGGVGYLILFALLLLATIAAVLIILLPVALHFRRFFQVEGKHKSLKNQRTAVNIDWSSLFYFAFLGFAFLLIEIPLIQKFTLYIETPTYAFTTVVFTILFFSGFGSQLSKSINLWVLMPILILSLILLPSVVIPILQPTLGYPLIIRILSTIMILAPVGFMMGVPFPGGLRTLLSGPNENQSIPIAWAINGAASVIAAILAALLAFWIGFTGVFVIGAICYFGAWVIILIKVRFPRYQPLNP